MNNEDVNSIDLNDIEKLSAYLDNELSPTDRAELEQKLSQSDRLQQALAKLQSTNSIASMYFSELDKTPMPDSLEAMIRNAKPSGSIHDTSLEKQQATHQSEQKNATIVDLFRRKKNKIYVPSWGLASAASVLFALGLWMLMPPMSSNINGSLLAILNTEPSGRVISINSELKIEVLASYQHQNGQVCRALVKHSPVSSNPALACLNEGQWQIETTELGDNYQTASSLAPVNRDGLMTTEEERIWLRQISE